ncbi:FxsA family protein [Ammoniphilus sp. CFH 90114]|uniref:FxsA family protein n=1 Tax=Ammoniphilus sp. CFH 90114 TaxID=2493665 RepID=UPI00100FC0D5|nr:FxsA family protein [Ammoniphilus sp. CFH 90114]RXT04174.1 membrane protein FxsA [Ammoniphilus sp. CFH 90114]
MKFLVAILIIVPAIEIWGLITAGQAFGWLPTLALVILTGVLGAWLAKQQGLQIFQLAQAQLQRGELPGEAILDGILIFAGGLVLLTPGFFTDAMGFILLIPATRGMVKVYVKRWLLNNIQNGKISFYGGNFRRW